MNPFTLAIQKRTITLRFRVNDSFWHTSDVESMLRDIEETARHGWRIDHCIRHPDKEEIEIFAWRNRMRFRAFFEPWEIVHNKESV